MLTVWKCTSVCVCVCVCVVHVCVCVVCVCGAVVNDVGEALQQVPLDVCWLATLTDATLHQ